MDQRGDLCWRALGLAGEEGDGVPQAGERAGIAGGVEALLLHAEIGGDLAQPGGKSGELLLLRRGRSGGFSRLASAKAAMTRHRSDRSSRDSPCLGEVPDRGVGDGTGGPCCHRARKAACSNPPEASITTSSAACSQHNRPARRRLGIVGEAPMARRLDPGIEPGFGNIHSTNGLHHGNLPCLCD